MERLACAVGVAVALALIAQLTERYAGLTFGMQRFIIHANLMSNDRTIDQLIDTYNAQAQAEGRYDRHAFWEVPARSGSLSDIPETEKAKEDLAWFRARRLEKEKAWARSALQALLERIDANERVRVRWALQALREEADRLLAEQEPNA